MAFFYETTTIQNKEGRPIAAPKLMYASGNAGSTTTSTSMTNTDTSVPLTSTTNFSAAPTPGEGMLLLNEGAASEELAYGTALSGGSVTVPLANRGLEGGSAQAHSSGASVTSVLSAGMWNNMITALLNVLLQTTGALDTTKVVDLTTAQILTNKTLTAPIITNKSSTGTDSGVETLTNKTLTTPTITKPVMDATNPSAQTYSPGAGGTATLDLSLANEHRITMPAGNITIALSNDTLGQKFIISITQDGVGSRTVTWFATIKWAGGVAPTLTTTASKRDTFGFIRTGAATYDGFVVGQNI